MRSVLVLACVLGCQQSKPAPGPEPAPAKPARAPAKPVPPALVPIEHVPGLTMPRYDRAERDCRLSAVARRRFAGAKVEPCGAYDLAESPEASARDGDTARTCVEAAIAAKQPFIAEKQVQGIDSGVARGIVGVLEHGELAIYALSYDSNPCGGGCPEAGHTQVRHCTKLAFADGCPDPFACFECDGDELVDLVEDCIYVSPTPEGCIADRAAQQACEAKGPRFEYGRAKELWCKGMRPSPREEAVRAKAARRPQACSCLDRVAERAREERCAHLP
jgi:hypothetical protein